jgi:hypothetical protein
MRSYHNHEDGFYITYRAMGRALHQNPLLATLGRLFGFWQCPLRAKYLPFDSQP